MSLKHYTQKVMYKHHELILYKDDDYNIVRISLPVSALFDSHSIHKIILLVRQYKEQEQKHEDQKFQKCEEEG